MSHIPSYLFSEVVPLPDICPANSLDFTMYLEFKYWLLNGATLTLAS